jgi:type IV pilus assembly protein PilO
MATKRSSPKIDVGAALRSFGQQFQGLNPNDPSAWPAIPRYALCVAVAAAVVVALWFVWLTNSNDELDAARAKELALRADYQKKVAQAVNLELLKKQREQVQQYVTLLEKQLPSKAKWMRCCRTSTRRASDAACSSSCSGPGRSRSRTTTPSSRSRCA